MEDSSENYVVKAGIGVAVFLLVCIGSIQIYTKYQGKKRKSNFLKSSSETFSKESSEQSEKSKYHNKIMTLSYKILAKSF